MSRVVSGVNLFVLNNVLFPQSRQPLVVFEPKYLVMAKEVLQNPKPTFGYVKAKVSSSDKSYKGLLKTEWNGEDTGTLAEVTHSEKEPATNHILMDVLGTHRFRIMEKQRTLFGYWTGTVELLDEELKVVESEKGLAIEAKKLVRECFEKSPRFRGSILNFDSLIDPEQPNGDLASFSFQLADLLPTSQKEKQQMLSTHSLSERLLLQTHLLKGYLQPEGPKIDPTK